MVKAPWCAKVSKFGLLLYCKPCYFQYKPTVFALAERTRCWFVPVSLIFPVLKILSATVMIFCLIEKFQPVVLSFGIVFPRTPVSVVYYQLLHYLVYNSVLLLASIRLNCCHDPRATLLIGPLLRGYS